MTNSAILDLQSTLEIVNDWLDTGKAQDSIFVRNAIDELQLAADELDSNKDNLVHSIFTIVEIDQLIQCTLNTRKALIELSE